MKTIQVSECYALHVHTRNVLATSQRHLQITSSFTGAKDPKDQRELFSVTLSPAQYNELTEAIKAAP